MLASQAFALEKHTARINQEQVRLIRIGDAEIEAIPDGLELNVAEGDIPACGGAPGRSGVPISGGVSIRALLLDPESIVSQLQIDRYRTLCETAAACIWLTTEGNTHALPHSLGMAFYSLCARPAREQWRSSRLLDRCRSVIWSWSRHSWAINRPGSP
jgi:hypothetical protein